MVVVCVLFVVVCGLLHVDYIVLFVCGLFSVICYVFFVMCYLLFVIVSIRFVMCFVVFVLCFCSLYFVVGPLVCALLNMLFDMFCFPWCLVAVLDYVLSNKYYLFFVLCYL